MLLAPLIVQVSDKIVLRFVASEWLLRSMELTRVAAYSMGTEKHIIICGYGRSGQYLARFLEQEDVAFMALDLDPERVRDAAAAGENVVYGDASRHETLVAAGIQRASALVITFADVHNALKVMHHAQALRPDLPVVVRATDEAEMEKLARGGAVEVVPEAFEASLMLASHALALTGVPITRVVRHIRELRAQRYALMRGFFHGATDSADSPDAQQARLRSVILEADAFAVGRSLAELGLVDAEVGVSAIRRRGIRGVNPAPETRLLAGDVLVLLGPPEALARAETRLNSGE
jgi:CPA2 family monovalent cation:H+ antiporter-2